MKPVGQLRFQRCTIAALTSQSLAGGILTPLVQLPLIDGFEVHSSPNLSPHTSRTRLPEEQDQGIPCENALHSKHYVLFLTQQAVSHSIYGLYAKHPSRH